MAAALLVACALAEALATLALAFLRGDHRSDFPGVRARHAASSLESHLAAAGDPGTGSAGAAATLRIDPHLGWVHAAGPGVNNAGFRSPVDYPYAAPAGEMVVGVFGGSVAESLCSRQRRRLESGLREVAASRGYASVRVLCFAIVGHREPQGLFAFERYADTVDLAIFLEGFNEVVFWHEPGYPADFPNVALWRPFANAPSPREVALAGRRDALAADRRALAAAFDVPVLRHSAAVHLGWEVLAARLDRARDALELEAEEVARAARTGRDPAGFDEARARDRYLVGLEGTLRDAAAIGRRRRVPLFHALQPNQYVDGSKTFTEEEEQRFRGNAAIRRFVAAGWPRLRSAWSAASADGLEAVDLTEVFVGTGETVYGDDCCHLNDLGNRLLAERLLAEIASRPGLVEGIAAPGSRPERLVAPNGSEGTGAPGDGAPSASPGAIAPPGPAAIAPAEPAPGA